MKKKYLSPEAELLAFAAEDVITSSGTLNDWNTPTVDVGNGDGDWTWSENGGCFTITEKV